MIEMDSLVVAMDYIKQESECCCCFSKENLLSLLEPYIFEENVEVYSTMIAECFQIELNSYVEEYNRNLYLICKNCVFRLRDAINLRSQIQIAYDCLQAECCTKGNLISKYSDLIETKEHILEYNISECENMECNMNVDSGDSESNENVLKLKHIRVVLPKIDNNTMENVLIVSANGAPGAKSPPSKTFFCKICNKLCRNMSAIRNHMKSHLDTNEKTCTYCNKKFSSIYTLLRHQKIHSDVRDFVCVHCKKEFTREDHMKKHILIHIHAKSIKCALCDKSFTSRINFLKHKSRCRPVRLRLNNTNKKTYKHCNKAFGNNKSLSRHEKLHPQLDANNIICDYCKKKFSRKGNLKRHILTHTCSKSGKCNLCDKRFASLANFLNHKRICHPKRLHPKTENKTTCKYCNKKFTYLSGLLRHKKIHFNKKDYVCYYCDKAFIRHDHLTRHLRTHRYIKSVKCELFES